MKKRIIILFLLSCGLLQAQELRPTKRGLFYDNSPIETSFFEQQADETMNCEADLLLFNGDRVVSADTLLKRKLEQKGYNIRLIESKDQWDRFSLLIEQNISSSRYKVLRAHAIGGGRAVFYTHIYNAIIRSPFGHRFQATSKQISVTVDPQLYHRGIDLLPACPLLN